MATTTALPTSYVTGVATGEELHLNAVDGGVDLEVIAEDGSSAAITLTVEELRRHVTQCMALLATAGAL